MNTARMFAAGAAAVAIAFGPARGDEIDVYLIAGQSNAINFADESAEGTTDVGFDLHFARTSKDFLPPYTDVAESFSGNLLDANEAVTDMARSLNLGDMAVFAFSRNGTPLAIEPGRIDTWYPGDDPVNGQRKDDSMYGNFVTWIGARLTELSDAGHTPVVRGLFWFQGERDGVLGTPQAEHETNFTNLVHRLREDFGASLPIVATRIREVGTDVANRIAVNQAMQNVADADPLMGLVETGDLSWLSATNVHLSSAGYFELASVWAGEMLALQNSPISWNAAGITTGKSDLIEGDVIVALNGGPLPVTITNGGINGSSTYDFGATDFTDLGSHLFKPSDNNDSATANVEPNVYSPGAIATTGDAGFDGLVSSLATSAGSPSGITSGTLMLDGLTPGETYFVQIFSNDQRTPVSNLTTTFGDVESSPNTVDLVIGNPETGVQASDYGRFAVGTFTATGNRQAVSLELTDPGSDQEEPVNLLANGSFESPYHTRNDGTDPDDWTVIETAAGNFPDRQVRTKNSLFRSGSMGLFLGAGNANRDGQLHQSFPTEPGMDYSLSGWYISPQGNNRQAFAVNVIDGSSIGGTLIASSGTISATNVSWQEFTIEFTASGTATTVHILDQGTLAADNASLVLDDLAAREVQPPLIATLTDIHFNAILVTAPSNFQLWAHDRGVPAIPDADSDHNGVPELVEFCTGTASLPTLQSDNQISIVVGNEALDDGYVLNLEYTLDLEEWTRATTETLAIRLLSSTAQPDGNLDLAFEVDNASHGQLYWRLVVD